VHGRHRCGQSSPPGADRSGPNPTADHGHQSDHFVCSKEYHAHELQRQRRDQLRRREHDAGAASSVEHRDQGLDQDHRVLVFLAAVAAVAVTSLLVGQDENTGVDPFSALDALRYITILSIGYMLARGLAKSGSRANDTS